MQNSVTPKLKQFARQLLDYEAQSGSSAGESRAVFRVCDKLRGSLSKLMGTGGFSALFGRALVLARADVHWLGMLQVKKDGSLEGLEQVESQLSQDEVELGEAALVAHLLSLLITLIGSALTLTLVQEAWPEAAFNQKNLADEETL